MSKLIRRRSTCTSALESNPSKPAWRNSGYACIALAWLFSSSLAMAGSLELSFGRMPQAITQDAHAVFEFSAAAANGYECALDGSEFGSCASPLVLLDLAEGSHSLQVRAVDIFGGQGKSASVDWQVTSVFDGYPDLVPTTQMPAPVAANSWKGIFRINCDFAHASYDDPLVYPGRPYAAHYHKFFGNVSVDYNTTMESLHAFEAAAGEPTSTCQGNTLNRSAYWYPSVLAPAFDTTGNRLLDDAGNPAWKPVQAVVGNDDVAHEIFYYSAGIDDISVVQPIPVGLSMIAGTASTGPGETQSSDIIRWHCQTWASDDTTHPDFRGEIPECFAPDRLRADLFFPSCWNGIDLDSPDHKSHMAYPVDGEGRAGKVCPDSHPVAIARVSYHLAFPVKPENYDPGTRSTRGWRLASDMYEVDESVRGGRSLHADWMNGWHPEVMQAIVDNCIRAGRDCHDGNLANGLRLSGVAAGTQTLPEVINQGMGPSHSGMEAEPVQSFWWDRAEEGPGIDLRKAGDDYVVFLLTHDELAEPVWYLGAGKMQGSLLALHMQRFDYQETRFPPQHPVESSGMLLTLDFGDAGNHTACADGIDRSDAVDLAEASLSVNGRNEQWCIEPRLTAPAPATDYSGLWVPDDWLDGGWGVSLWQHQTHATGSTFLVYFYDGAGNGRWVMGTGESAQPGGYLTAPLWQTAPEDETVTWVGEIELDLARSEQSQLDGNFLSLEIRYPGQATGSWRRNGIPVWRLLRGAQ